MTENSLTTTDKALRVDRALRLKRVALRRSGQFTLANVLNGLVQNETETFKARLFDLIVADETAEEMLGSSFGNTGIVDI